MRAEPDSPTERGRGLGCLRAGGGAGKRGKELRGAEEEEEVGTEEEEGTLCALQAVWEDSNMEGGWRDGSEDKEEVEKDLEEEGVKEEKTVASKASAGEESQWKL